MSSINTNGLDKAMEAYQANPAAYAPLPVANDPQAQIVNPDIDAIVAQTAKEAALNAQYGNQPGRALLESAASAATLGASDQYLAATSDERDPAKTMREVRSRSPYAAGAGTALGIVAPMLTGAGEFSGPGAIAKLGGATDAFATKALMQATRSKAVTQILAKTAAGAVEGAAYGAGNLVSEDALGEADFNGQNLIASAGAGALLGAGFGAAHGTINATVPLASKLVRPFTSKLADYTDPVAAAESLSGLTDRQLTKANKFNKSFSEDLPAYFNEQLDHGVLTSSKDLLESNLTIKASAGRQIGQISDTLDGVLKEAPELGPTRAEAVAPLRQALQEEEQALDGVRNVSKDKLNTLENFRKDLADFETAGGPFRFKQFDNMRRAWQDIKFKGGGELESFKADVANSLRAVARDSINDIADKVAANSAAASTSVAPEMLADIGNKLRQANKTFSVAATLEPGLMKQAERKVGVKFSLGDLIEPIKNTARSVAVLADMWKQKEATQALIGKSMSGFFTTVKKAGSAASLKALTSSGFAIGPQQEAPKNAKIAFQNISNNLAKLATDPDTLVDRLAKSTARVQYAAPKAAAEMHDSLIKGVQFLSQNLPRSMNSGSGIMFQRPYQPTSIELAKFQRYVQAVEHPLSTLDDLERGTLTHEHVQVLQTVYPAIYKELQQAAINEVGKNGDKLSYSKKLTLGLLLNVPTDESLEPHAIQFLQANFAPKAPEAGPASGGTKVAGSRADKVDFASRAQTGTEKVINRA